MADHAVHTVPQATYWYRRSLRPIELMPAVGAAVGAGLLAFYVARLLLQRTALAGSRPDPHAPRVEPKRAAGADASAARAVFRR